jgi:phosphoglycerate kinase
MKTIREIGGLNKKTVLLRADLDEPHNGKNLLDDYRIRKSLPSIQYLLERGATVIIISKIGRPKKSFDPEQTLAPAAECLAKLLKRRVVTTDSSLPAFAENRLIFFTGDIRKAENLAALKDLPQRSLVLLENIRFYPEEENCDPEFAKNLASLGDTYVNDAFAMDHRNEVSVSMLPKILPGYAGLELSTELQALNRVMTMEVKPFIIIMGGAKISDKVETIKNLAPQADAVLVGGALANLFLLAKGMEIGLSFCEHDKVELAADLLKNYPDKIILPIDVIVSDASKVHTSIISADSVLPEQGIYDIGPKTILEFSNQIHNARKMVWNGPLGLFEEHQFATGTMSVARMFAARCQGAAYGLAGGGDTLEAINQAAIADQVDFVSTGGGAMLEYLAGHKLPGVEALG